MDTDEMEEFIQEWYWNRSSHELARHIAQFLFQFLDWPRAKGVSDPTLQKHRDNCWTIGFLTCQFGDIDEFSPPEFLYGPHYLDEFMRKFSDSSYAVQSYTATWRRLGRYVRELGYAGEDD